MIHWQYTHRVHHFWGLETPKELEKDSLKEMTAPLSLDSGIQNIILAAMEWYMGDFKTKIKHYQHTMEEHFSEAITSTTSQVMLAISQGIKDD
jgi:hypothetical protein